MKLPSVPIGYALPHCLVSTIDPLASAAGFDVLAQGGSAVDAAIAANAVLAVTSPDQCGLGGDLVALVHSGPSARGGEAIDSLLAVGKAPSGASSAALRDQGHERIPRHSIDAVTVPGAVDGWLALHQRYGRIRLDQVLAPAIAYAEEGFPASARLARHLEELAPPGSHPLVDELRAASSRPAVLTSPGTARVLTAISKLGREGFYAGEFGAELVQLGQGRLAPSDLATPQARFLQPVATPAFGLTLLGTPPPSASFLAMGILAALDDRPTDPWSARWFAELISTTRATSWMRRYHYDGADVPAVLRGDRPERTTRVGRLDGDTTAMIAIDRQGMAAVIVQSNGHAFGTGIATPQTGVFLHDRGAIGFNLVPGDPNELRPGARPRHTLAPLVAIDGAHRLVAVAGTMGGDRQVTIMAQLLAAAVRDGADPAEVLAAPRFAFRGDSAGDLAGFDTWDRDERTLGIESHAGEAVHAELAAHVGALARFDAFAAEHGVAHLAVRRGELWLSAVDPRSEQGAVVGR
jgi:gamma-glutamyltranspeptidase/glutathione hydrolase